MKRQIVLDTETTGLRVEEKHRVIEIGCLEMVNRQLTGKHFHRYINPRREIESRAVQVHGITNTFLADKPFFEDFADELVQFLDGAELIIHNAPFDVGFLNYELALTQKAFKRIIDYCSIIDTLVLARQKHPGKRVDLNSLCREYQVNNSHRKYHGALLDAELLAQVYLLMTGGQATLFGLENSTGTASAHIRRVSSDRQPLRVIAANNAELKAHKAFEETLISSED